VAAPAAPAPVAAPVRSIAAVPAPVTAPPETPAAPAPKKHGKAKAKGHDKHQSVQDNEGDGDEADDAVTPPAEQQSAAAPVEQTAPASVPSPTDENGDSQGDGGPGNGNGNGKGNGNANGHSHGHGG
jgi:hypothetical protein